MGPPDLGKRRRRDPKHDPSPRGAGAKIWVFGWFGEKYDDLLSKKANIIGKGVEKLEKGEIFTVLGGKNMILEKKGGWGKNIPFLGNIYPWVAGV